MLLLHSSLMNVNSIKHYIVVSVSHAGLMGSIIWFWLCSQLWFNIQILLPSLVNLLHELFLCRSLLLRLRLHWEPVLVKFDTPTGERSLFADFLQLVDAYRLRIPKENAEP